MVMAMYIIITMVSPCTLKCYLHHIFVIGEVPEIPSPFIKSLEEDQYQRNVTSNYGNYL